MPIHASRRSRARLPHAAASSCSTSGGPPPGSTRHSLPHDCASTPVSASRALSAAMPTCDALCSLDGTRRVSWPEFAPQTLLRTLVRHGVDFVVVGGVAMVIHGSTRLTQDLDICFATDQANLDVLGAALIELEAKLRGIEEDVPFTPDGRTLGQLSITTLDTSQGPIDLLRE